MQAWQEFHYRSVDDLKLAGRKYGWNNHGNSAVVCLPGLTRNAADFHELAVHLSQDKISPRRVLALDYRGRGLSQYDKNFNNYSILREADDVLQGIVAAGLGHVNIIGTSRGGLIAMVLAALRPTILKSVTLNDIGPEIDGAGLVRIKTYVENMKDHTNWADATAYIKEIGQAHFPNWDDATWEKQARLIYHEIKGRIKRNYDPALLKTLQAIDLDSRIPDLWPQFFGLKKIPLMLIRGANTDLLTMETVEKMKHIHSTIKFVNVADQGHAPDLGSAGLPEQISAFLARQD